MSLMFHKNLLLDISLMLNDSNDHDVIIQVGKNENIKRFRVHSNILKARSNYFKRALSVEWTTKKNNVVEFKKPNIDPAVFEMILSFIYRGEVDLMNQSGEFIFKLLIASDELLLEELFYHLQDYLIKERSIWTQENLIFVYNTVSTLYNCKKLHYYCMESILKKPKLFINSKDFPLFDKDNLCELLKRDDFLIDEIVIWDYLIKWSIEKTPSLKSKNRDRTKWNNEDYDALKEVFNQFIPLIRFSEISSADFFDKIHPFKAIIPNDIYEGFMGFHMKGILPKNITISSPRIGKLNIASRIIEPKHAYMIANWIEGKDAKAVRNENDLQYKFNLLYSSSRDGSNISTFRSKCMNKGPCLILIKSLPTQPTNLAKIYGEYYSGIFTQDIWQYNTKNFIFSFANDNDIKNSKICRMNYNIEVEKYGKDFDPSITFRMKGQNIRIDNSYYNDNNNVINSIITQFVSMEIEVFKVLNGRNNTTRVIERRGDVTEFYLNTTNRIKNIMH